MATNFNSKNKQFGQLGEAIAKEHLQKLGYKILDANFRYRRGEVDLICQDGTFMVFVEVKTRYNAAYGYPEQALGRKQFRQIQAVAAHYLQVKRWKGPIRFDVVAVLFYPRQEIRVFKDFFL
ncbi:YraN family protein [Persicobacter diffluens]|uniref:UPF0102 protein PEDI_26460 n=1 Tax=Persicobacter diffluens TaxID=981 RepID=A0AAN5AKH3_9BACT|nr:UPF0102 protein [Persicobacter diffluens]